MSATPMCPGSPASSTANEPRAATHLGAILCGGASRRFGAPKALAEISGVPIIVRVRDTLQRVLPSVVLITGEKSDLGGLDLRRRADTVAGRGPLGGIHAALRWAHERGLAGALCVACDMPFLSAPLLHHLVERASGGDAQVIVPSGGTHAPEPLCAVYSVGCIPEVEYRLGRGEGSITALLQTLRVDVVPVSEVRRYGDPDVIFMNVNTPADHQRALRIATRCGRIDDA